MAGAGNGKLSPLTVYEPLCLPLTTIADGRGFASYDLFALAESYGIQIDNSGQVNATTTYPGIKRGWHRHKEQFDCMAVVFGDAIVAAWKMVDSSREEIESKIFYIDEHNPSLVIIPPGWWHGLTPVGGKPCLMIYYVSNKFDPAKPDEERLPYDDHDSPKLLE